MNNLKTGVIIASGGLGTRFGGDKPKQFLEINGKPVITLTLEKFHQCEYVDYIVIASHPEYINYINKIIEENNFSKVVSVVAGGRHRQDSVWNAIREIVKWEFDILLIHDAVRPFITHEIIKEIIKTASEYGAAVPAVVPKDTIKIANADGFVLETPDRSTLCAVQTPQGFQKNVIIEAYEKAYSDKIYTTDDSSLAERIGKNVKIVKGDYKNIKITTKEDLIVIL